MIMKTKNMYCNERMRSGFSCDFFWKMLKFNGEYSANVNKKENKTVLQAQATSTLSY